MIKDNKKDDWEVDLVKRIKKYKKIEKKIINIITRF